MTEFFFFMLSENILNIFFVFLIYGVIISKKENWFNRQTLLSTQEDLLRLMRLIVKNHVSKIPQGIPLFLCIKLCGLQWVRREGHSMT